MLRNMPQLTGNSDEDIIVLYDYVLSLRREIYDTLNNLDDDNFAKITAKSIETSTLVVGDNIEMGPNAVISWGQVSNPPFIPQTPEDLQALALDSPMLTYIDQYGIYTGSLTANQITAGTISASRIDTTNLYAERIKQPGYSNNYGIIGGPLGGLALYQSGDHYFSIYKGALEAYLYAMDDNFLSSSGYSTFAYNNWDFTTADYVDIDGYALENHSHGNTYIKNYSAGDSISISATEFGLIIRDGSTILGQIDYDIIGG
jgi:hypothetical protein